MAFNITYQAVYVFFLPVLPKFQSSVRVRPSTNMDVQLPNTCLHCEKTFQTIKELRDHSFRKRGDKTYGCVARMHNSRPASPSPATTPSPISSPGNRELDEQMDEYDAFEDSQNNFEIINNTFFRIGVPEFEEEKGYKDNYEAIKDEFGIPNLKRNLQKTILEEKPVFYIKGAAKATIDSIKQAKDTLLETKVEDNLKQRKIKKNTMIRSLVKWLKKRRKYIKKWTILSSVTSIVRGL